jgi:uncharacterized protein (DUF58 family)
VRRLALLSRLSREGRLLLSSACGAAVLGVDVGRTDTHALLLSVAVLSLVSVGFSWAYPLRGVKAQARAPRRVPVGEELRISIRVRNDGPGRHEALRVEGPRLPWDASWSGDSPTLPALAPGEEASAELRVRYRRRGERKLGPTRVAALVPLGLAQSEPALTEGLRFVVVPRVARVTRVTTPTARKHQPGGIAQASQVGDTSELLGLRPYRPGDPIRDIHMTSWAKLGEPVVREYQQEYFTRVGVVLDTGKIRDGERFEAALSLAAGVIARLCGGETLVDLLVAGESVHRLSLGRSLGTLEQALDVLAGVQPGPPFSSARILARLGPHLDRLSSVVLIALRWDEERRGLLAKIQRRGVGCAALVLGEANGAETWVRQVPVAAVLRGEALAL